MSNGRGNQRKGQGGGGGGGGQQRRRGRSGRSGGGSQGGGGGYAQQPRGPQMTALGESTYEAVFDHGNEGYGVWFDGVVREDPMYRQFWKGNRNIFVKIEDDRIVISKKLDRGEDLQDDSADEDLPDIGNEADGASAADLASRSFGPDDPSPERVYSPEEAAQLFADEAGEAAGEEASASANGNGDGEAAPTSRRRVARRTTAASDDAGDEAEEKPRRTRTRRTKADAAEEPAAEADSGDGDGDE